MVKVYISSVIDAPADRVWAAIRDFNALPKWHPAIKDSHVEGGLPSDRVGCIRNFNLKDGGNIREQLLTLSDYDYNYTYSILESPLGVRNYIATLNGRRSSIATPTRPRRWPMASAMACFRAASTG